MSQNLSNLRQTCPVHSEIGCCGVSEIVEAKIRYPSTFNGIFKGFTDTYRSPTCPIGKNKGRIVSADLGMVGKDIQRIPCQWNCSGLTIFGLTKCEHPAFQVHI